MKGTSVEADKPRRVELYPLPLMTDQDGYDCKTHALSGVLDWLYQCNRINEQPAPARKRFNKEFKGKSLRWHLKHSYGSAVGEVHNVEDLASLAVLNKQVVANYGICETRDDYFSTLKNAIDLGLAPIVFFDDGNDNLPVLDHGKSEHSAVVVGYSYHQDDKIHFKVSQYGKYYEFDGKSLYDSASQLPKVRLSPEIYCKIRKFKNKEGAWLSESYVDQYGLHDRVIKRIFETSPTKSHGLYKTILILDSAIKPILDYKNQNTHSQKVLPSMTHTLFHRPVKLPEYKEAQQLPQPDTRNDCVIV